jgi:2,4-dienoyl-CoA reductase-like NADH-dependent reductase (Old Yellow Enzyme family)
MTLGCFKPITIGNMKLRNRFVRSATVEGMATNKGQPIPLLKKFYCDLADGGIALIITGASLVESYTNLPDIEGVGFPATIDNDRFIRDWQDIVSEVHQHGAKIAMQIVHPGRQDDPNLRTPIAPSAVPLENKDIVPHEMTVEEIHAMVEKFAQACRRAYESGFDAVQLHGGHGYLISNFLSPYTNRRTDEYGGSTLNRARFVLDILKRVHELIGTHFPIPIKMNCDDFIEGGMTSHEAVAIAKILTQAGIAAIEVTGGITSNNPQRTYAKGINKREKEAYFRTYAKTIKENISSPVILVGGLRSLEVIEKLITDGITDLVSMSRPFIREPGLIQRWMEGDLKRAQCISCNKCHDNMYWGGYLRCYMKKG